MNYKDFTSALSAMPLKKHAMGDGPFEIDKSELLSWVMSAPGFKVWLYYQVIHTGRVQFNKEAGGWVGMPKVEKAPKPEKQARREAGEQVSMGGRPPLWSRSEVLEHIRRLAPDYQHAAKLTYLWKQIAQSMPIGKAVLWAIMGELVKGNLVGVDKECGPLYWAKPAVGDGTEVVDV